MDMLFIFNMFILNYKELNCSILFGNNLVLLLNFLSFICNLFHYWRIWRILIVYAIN